METSLHRQLKHLYAGEDAATEVQFGRYRIDAVVGEELVEVQCASLSAIGPKIKALVKQRPVRVVKPLIARKRIVRRKKSGGEIISNRLSPKKGTWLDLFDDLVYFTKVFPHDNLTLEVPLVHIEEHRVPGHGKRRRWRQNDHTVEDIQLIEVLETRRITTADQLWKFVPGKLPKEFDTSDLARVVGCQRWIAQRIAYCLRETGAAEPVGKRGNAVTYAKAKKRKKAKAA
ncbi:hypothetical protein [Blastopirellula retiformator]|uniref:DUF8091 domain-containing protein n=1 Tax=Blastopirellula retiformator TaxID=2527970 RepID=A0A5C5V1F6_9BACT|nr:hypothetical protein [Blastopirellula retiformator]TWT31839.1 hypothetical protein Enr8_37640 [Blastopirellula retiformator]